MYKTDNSCFYTSSVTFLYGFNFNLFNTIPFRIFHDAGTSYKLLEPQQLGGLRAGRTVTGLVLGEQIGEQILPWGVTV